MFSNAAHRKEACRFNKVAQSTMWIQRRTRESFWKRTREGDEVVKEADRSELGLMIGNPMGLNGRRLLHRDIP